MKNWHSPRRSFPQKGTFSFNRNRMSFFPVSLRWWGSTSQQSLVMLQRWLSPSSSSSSSSPSSSSSSSSSSLQGVHCHPLSATSWALVNGASKSNPHGSATLKRDSLASCSPTVAAVKGSPGLASFENKIFEPHHLRGIILPAVLLDVNFGSSPNLWPFRLTRGQEPQARAISARRIVTWQSGLHAYVRLVGCSKSTLANRLMTGRWLTFFSSDIKANPWPKMLYVTLAPTSLTPTAPEIQGVTLRLKPQFL